MLNLYSIATSARSKENTLSEEETFSVLYHNLFDYPLSFSDLIRWKAGTLAISNKPLAISNKNGFYFVEGKEGVIYKRTLRERISTHKYEIAKKAAKVLSILPTVKLVAVTGSLAMNNSSDGSDIDLLIVTKAGTLWTTRLLAYFSLFASRFSLRRPMDKQQKDKLCLNMWLDESDLVWRERNFYTAHEIAQIVPLVNKGNTYEKFLSKNKWILDYWPNAVKIRNPKSEIRNKFEISKFKYLKIVSNLVLRASNLIAFKLQYWHMKSKMTRETVTKTRALFHPQDWSETVLTRLGMLD